MQRLAPLVPRNTRRGAVKNIAAHYDLGNELFATFLDERMMYSCALFEEPDASLEEAQLAKLDRICKQLRLGPGDELIEIGTGWGGMAIHAATRHGCRVTTATISREQHSLATERVRAAGVDHLVKVLDQDYRDLRGEFTKLVSIEMIEAVGWQYFDSYFRTCSELLRPDGLALIQAIVIDDRAYEIEKSSKSFANTHVFPGGCLPSLAAIGERVSRVTDTNAVWHQDISAHYVRTLQLWRERFEAGFERLRARGYDERFRRLWRFYLSFCEAGFTERRIRDVQLLLAKPQWRGDALATPASVRLSESTTRA
jgi:cyclopropane-fatty-acyl-phospholipid synthase